MKKLAIIIAVASIALLGAGCNEGYGGGNETVEGDQAVSNRSLDRFQETQPIPEFPWSQLRQNLIELNTAQAETTATTTFFFNMGVTDPVASCPSIGFPIPSTAQLTNPLQPYEFDGNDEGGTNLPLPEQTGIYTGDSTGTYVICVTSDGEAYADYWEGFVKTVTGTAEWVDGEVKLIGEPSFDFSEGEK